MKWWHAVAALTLGPFLAGCVVTGTMWKEADATRMSRPEAVGVLCRDGSPDSRAVVVRYVLDTNWRMWSRPYVYVLVPLASDAKPAEPFRYEGNARTAEQIEKALSDAHQDVLRHVKLELAGPPAVAPHRLAGFKPSDPSHPDGNAGVGGSMLPPAAVAVALEPLPDGGLRSVESRWDSPLPVGATVVLLPSETTRPPADSEAARRRAAFFTPLTLLADVVVTPVVIGAYILNGGG